MSIRDLSFSSSLIARWRATSVDGGVVTTKLFSVVLKHSILVVKFKKLSDNRSSRLYVVVVVIVGACIMQIVAKSAYIGLQRSHIERVIRNNLCWCSL